MRRIGLLGYAWAAAAFGKADSTNGNSAATSLERTIMISSWSTCLCPAVPSVAGLSLGNLLRRNVEFK
jgi:hypothetical protein